MELQAEIEKLLTDQKKRSSSWETYVVGKRRAVLTSEMNGRLLNASFGKPTTII